MSIPELLDEAEALIVKHDQAVETKQPNLATLYLVNAERRMNEAQALINNRKVAA